VGTSHRGTLVVVASVPGGACRAECLIHLPRGPCHPTCLAPAIQGPPAPPRNPPKSVGTGPLVVCRDTTGGKVARLRVGAHCTGHGACAVSVAGVTRGAAARRAHPCEGRGTHWVVTHSCSPSTISGEGGLRCSAGVGPVGEERWRRARACSDGCCVEKCDEQKEGCWYSPRSHMLCLGQAAPGLRYVTTLVTVGEARGSRLEGLQGRTEVVFKKERRIQDATSRLLNCDTGLGLNFIHYSERF
jgi:hypothetical protein